METLACRDCASRESFLSELCHWVSAREERCAGAAVTSLWRHLHAGIVPAERASCPNCVTGIVHETCAVVWPGKNAVQVQQ